jgi:hypothetical protein
MKSRSEEADGEKSYPATGKVEKQPDQSGLCVESGSGTRVLVPR